MNNTDLGGFLANAVNTVGFDNLTPNVNTVIDSNTFVDLPIDYGIQSANEFELTETTPNLTEYVKTYNETFGSNEPELIRNIIANVGKLTKFRI